MNIFSFTSKNSPQTAKSLLSFWLEAFAVIAVLLIVSTVFILILDRQQSSIVAGKILEIRVDALAQRLSQTFTIYHSALERIATDATLVALIERGDNKLIAEKEQILVKTIPGALRVRLLKFGYETLDDTEPPLSYASLLLLRVAENSKQPPPLEIHQTKGKQLYLVGAAALRDNAGQTQGILHVMWNSTVISKEISAFATHEGQISLQQKVDNQLATILGFLSSDPAKANGDGSRSIAASQMQIAYWQTGSVETPLLMPSLWIIGFLILTYSLILGVQHWRLNQAIAADQAIALKMLEEILSGRRPKAVTVSIQELVGTIEFIAKIASSQTGKFTVAPPVPQKTVTEASTQSKKIEETKAETTTTTSVAKPTEVTQVTMPPTEATQAPKTESVQKVTPPAAKSGRPVEAASPADIEIPETLFRTYDIRGLIEPSVAYEIGRAFGSKLQELGQQAVSVARDNRVSGENLVAAVIQGLVNSGRDVINLGITTVPIAYFATHHLDTNAGIVVTAGRSPTDYNGFKILINKEIIVEDDLLSLRKLAVEGPLWQGMGSQREQDLLSVYIEHIANDVSIARPLKVVLDCGNGCASLVASQLFSTLGCDVVELFCELDHNYPNHQPDPIRPENLKALQSSVVAERADLGLAFDAEGDRIGVIDSRGRIIWPDRLLIALAADVLTRNPGGDVIFDVNCSRALASQILQNGGRPVMWKSGHAALKAKLRDTQALLAGDWSGHIIFQERWYGFDDACYVGARLLEILAVDPRTSAEFFDEYPDSVSTPEFTLKLREGEQDQLIKQLQKHTDVLGNARMITVEGIRAEYEDGWGLVRVSHTVPALRFRFEADNEQALERIQQSYRDLLMTVAPKLKLPF